MISAKVVLDSISPLGVRLTTLHCHFPRFILAEFNTHRVFSRNARSTRAVPTSKLIEEVRTNPVIPLRWQRNKPGMQGGEEVSPEEAAEMEIEWRSAAKNAADHAEKLFRLGLHKQWSGRILEPFMWVDVLVTSTSWANFEALRNHSDAQPEIELLAQKVIEARHNSTPKLLQPREWHLPYILDEEQDKFSLEEKQKISVARCARVSYVPFDGNASVEKELERYEKLVVSQPVHASPAEHQATPDIKLAGDWSWYRPHLHGNLRGWIQYRKTLSNEYIKDNYIA